jgi:hypothetical protein
MGDFSAFWLLLEHDYDFLKEIGTFWATFG